MLQSVTAAGYEQGGRQLWLDVYILQDKAGNYAVCGADGSWCSGFDYSAVYPMELGVLCVYDAAANLAVCYAETRAASSTRRTFSDRTMMAAESVSTLAQCEGGLMFCTYQRGTRASCAPTARR